MQNIIKQKGINDKVLTCFIGFIIMTLAKLPRQCSLLLKDLISDFIFDFTAAGVVPCGGRKTSPRTSTIVQFIFYFGPLRSAIIF